MSYYLFFVFKQKPEYELRISDCRSDVCSSDLVAVRHAVDRCRHEVRLIVPSRSRLPSLRGCIPAHAGFAGWMDVRSSSTSTTTVMPFERSTATDRKSVVEGTQGAVRVDHGVPRIIQKTQVKNRKKRTI